MGYNGDLYPTAGASVVMTTKGDMVDYDTERQRLGIGSTGQVLTVASSLPTWATLTTADSVLTTQGDVLYESASGLARLGFGTSGDVLTTKGTGANPVWETPSAGGAWTKLANDSGTSLDSGTLTDYDMYMVVGSCLCTTNGGILQMQINSDGSGNYDYEQGSKGTWSGIAAAGHIQISQSPAGAQMQNIFVGYFTQRQFSQDMHNFFIMDNPSIVGASSANYAIRCYGQHDESADISSFQITASTGSLHASSSMNVYGLNLA